MSEDFNSRLESAIERGKRRAQLKADETRRKELSEEELKRMHSSYRLSLSDQIEAAIAKVADHFPGFRQETLFGEVGWGAACYRDDLLIEAGRRRNQYSRMEMVIRPYSDLKVLELRGKATVQNRELFNRNHYVLIQEVDLDEFSQMIDAWAIDFAEMYAAKTSS
jgi:hypothetical protein